MWFLGIRIPAINQILRGQERGPTGYGVQTTGATTSMPAQHSYDVRGAMLSLQLPDGRIAVVNCTSKTKWTDLHHPDQLTRSCRIPPDNTATLQAKFDGAEAKLSWGWQEKRVISLNESKIVNTRKPRPTSSLTFSFRPRLPRWLHQNP
jgi:hypothetical protein